MCKAPTAGRYAGIVVVAAGSCSDASLGAPGRERGGGDARGAGAGGGDRDGGVPGGGGLREGAPPASAPRGGFPWAGAWGSPCARGYKSAARRQRATSQQPPAMSRGLQLLLLSCGRYRDRLSCSLPRPRPHRAPCPPPSSLAHAAASLPLAACSLAPAAWQVKVACSEDVDLPCTAPRDPQVPYTVSWAKVSAPLPAGWLWAAPWKAAGTSRLRLPTWRGCESGRPLQPDSEDSVFPHAPRTLAPTAGASRYTADLDVVPEDLHPLHPARGHVTNDPYKTQRSSLGSFWRPPVPVASRPGREPGGAFALGAGGCLSLAFLVHQFEGVWVGDLKGRTETAIEARFMGGGDLSIIPCLSCPWLPPSPLTAPSDSPAGSSRESVCEGA